jgi:hypothetical protein
LAVHILIEAELSLRNRVVDQAITVIIDTIAFFYGCNWSGTSRPPNKWVTCFEAKALTDSVFSFARTLGASGIFGAVTAAVIRCTCTISTAVTFIAVRVIRTLIETIGCFANGLAYATEASIIGHAW